MMNLNSSPSPFPIQEICEDHNHHQPPNFPSSSSVSCNFFFNSTQNYDQEDEDHYSFQGGSSSYEIKNKVENSGHKLTLWKKEDHSSRIAEQNINNNSNNNHNNGNPVKWMSTKMRLMQKMKYNPDSVSPKIITSNNATTKQENDQSSSMETEQLISNNSHNCNSPIRVCVDCNTTKTPLWRSGPKGPKSLCNACGIRQRKARRAMAAAAAAATDSVVQTDLHPSLKIKLQHKEKTPKIGHALPLKKRRKMTEAQAMGTPSNEQKKSGFEDFVINLNKNLNFHCVFPEDERDAAILLMALSSGLVHG